MIVSRIYCLTAASKYVANLVTPFNVMTQEQLNKAWRMMLSPAGERERVTGLPAHSVAQQNGYPPRPPCFKEATRESQEWAVFTPVTSEIWTTHWICAVSQLALLHRCPPDLSWLLSIKTRGWAEGTRHDRVECLIHAFSRGKTGRSFYTTVLFSLLLNKRQNIKSEQMCASGRASQTVSISNYRRVWGLFYI